MRTLHLAALAGSLVLTSALAGGCLRTTQFRCDVDTDCTGGTGGRCEPEGFCSFFDSACSGTQQRFADSAGSLSNTCVGGGDPDVDGGVDAPDVPDDGPPATGCPAGYAAVTGADPNHRYMLIATPGDWPAAANSCVASAPGRAYLAIPDDATELAALRNQLIAAPYWVGISDRTTENTFLNTKNMPQAFLPWAAGEPDDGMGGQDCVVARNATEIATQKCNDSFPAICECEP